MKFSLSAKPLSCESFDCFVKFYELKKESFFKSKWATHKSGEFERTRAHNSNLKIE